MRCYYFFFFFQAEDGIRDKLVTGVQTCALPILDPVDNGALSSCPAGEGHTWGKVSVEAVEAGSVYVHTDVTAVFPWLTHALLGDPKMKRKPKRLLDRLPGGPAFFGPRAQKKPREPRTTGVVFRGPSRPHT